MKHAHTLKRAMAVLLALVMTLSLVTPSWAAGRSTVATRGENNGITWEKVDNIKLPTKENAAVADETQQYADTDVVRVSIVLSDPSTLEKGFTAADIAAGSRQAMKYRDKLESKQEKMTKTISKKALDGQTLDVVWNLTLATNIISANVQYGQIEKIENVKGVKQVLIETRYEPCVVKESETTDPNMATSSNMIGSNFAWANGYTGAGSKVAIIDTGADTDHPSLSGAAYSYAVKGLGITPVTAADYADKLEKLNAFKKNGDLKASELYLVSSTTKVLTDFAALRQELERPEFRCVVPDFRLNRAFDRLDTLPRALRDKVEFLCNECCDFGCRERRACYEAVSRENLGEGGPVHRCASPDAAGGYRFSRAMENPGFIGVDDIRSTYLPKGFSQFKIEGRSLGSALLLEFLLHYLTRPPYHIHVREALYLDNGLDLF